MDLKDQLWTNGRSGSIRFQTVSPSSSPLFIEGLAIHQMDIKTAFWIRIDLGVDEELIYIYGAASRSFEGTTEGYCSPVIPGYAWRLEYSIRLSMSYQAILACSGQKRTTVYVNASHSGILVVVVVCFRQCHEVTLCRVGIAGAHNFTFFLWKQGANPSPSHLTLYLVFRTFFCSLTFVLSNFDFRMGGVFTKWEYWKSAQPRARVRLMVERPMWPCHSVYRETSRVERTISLLDFLTAPATISNKCTAKFWVRGYVFHIRCVSILK